MNRQYFEQGIKEDPNDFTLYKIYADFLQDENEEDLSRVWRFLGKNLISIQKLTKSVDIDIVDMYTLTTIPAWLTKYLNRYARKDFPKGLLWLTEEILIKDLVESLIKANNDGWVE